MNKQLLDQVQQALQAQQDTIQRQEQMLDSRDKDIAHLQDLLEQLTTTQTEQLERLPTLYEQLQNTIAEQREQQITWSNQVTEQVKLMNTLLSESTALSERQIRLIEIMKEYQSTIVPPEQLKSDTASLESELDELANSQKRIISSQELLKKQQQELQSLLRD